MKKSLIILLAVLIIIGGAFYYYQYEVGKKTTENEAVSNATEVAIKAQVTEFGTKLKNVSVLMPQADLQGLIKAEYGKYLTPELIARWQENPSLALGRNVSSPWPDRINVVEIVKQADGSYRVEGNVIEISSADSASSPVAVYPITLRVEERWNGWLIAGVSKGAYSELPKNVTVRGTWECLPHIETDGPQTLECAFGIQEDQTGKHYGMDLSLLQSGPVDFPTGTRLSVAGVLVTADQLSSSTWRKYPIEGIISVTSVQKI